MSNSKFATSAMASEKSSSVEGRTSKFIGVAKFKGKMDAYDAYVCDTEKRWRIVNLGTFLDEEDAARARDIATYKFLGEKESYNFPISEYGEILKLMENMTTEQVVASIKRCSSRFARAVDSNYRGVSRKSKTTWSSSYNRTYLGAFGTQEEAAMAYDIEAIKVKRLNAVTNFPVTLYNVEAILANPSSALDRARFIKKQHLDILQRYAKGEGKQFLEQIKHDLQVLISEPGENLKLISTQPQNSTEGETSNLISTQPWNSTENQLIVRANVERGGIQIDKLVEKNLEEVPPYHFQATAGSKFRHSSTSRFVPYGRPNLGSDTNPTGSIGANAGTIPRREVRPPNWSPDFVMG